MTDKFEKIPRVLNVCLNEVEVGTLTLLADDRTLFAFSQSYIENPERPILSLWFKDPIGELKLEEKMRRSAVLPPFFSNLLPEGHLRDYLAKKLGVKSEREFFLIAALGRDLPGAVRVLPADAIVDNENKEQANPLLKEEQKLRFSLAGVQLKFSAIMESTGGLTIPANGIGGSWIVKLPSHSYKNVPEAEYSMLKLAQRIGIDIPECKLISTASISGLPRDVNANSGDSLAIKRFDRGDNGIRIHMEDLAQVFGLYPAEKYEKASFDTIADRILSECGEDDFFKFIKRLVFTILIGNGDMHLKNWSLLYQDVRKPRLSPAYDFVPTIVYLPNDNLGLSLGGEKEFFKVKLDNFAKLASRAAASERMVLNSVQETAELIYDAWNKLRLDLPLTSEARSALDNHLNSLRFR